MVPSVGRPTASPRSVPRVHGNGGQLPAGPGVVQSSGKGHRVQAFGPAAHRSPETKGHSTAWVEPDISDTNFLATAVASIRPGFFCKVMPQELCEVQGPVAMRGFREAGSRWESKPPNKVMLNLRTGELAGTAGEQVSSPSSEQGAGKWMLGDEALEMLTSTVLLPIV